MTSQGNRGPHARLDAPIEDPSGDLLDIDEEALGLARYIRDKIKKLPFTLGVFGEWGEGKTTLVRLLQYHLSHPDGPDAPPREVDFVNFSAWPYSTSEKLWRALVIEIARTLYGPREGPAPRTEKGAPRAHGAGIFGAVAGLLSGEVVLRDREPDQYETYLRRLDRADYGNVGSRSAEVRVDEGAAMSAFVKGIVTALGTVSPLASGLRAFLGFDAKDDLAKIVRQNNEAERESIEALANFRKIFKEMIDGRPEGRREAGPVYVFIDDLDRAQPDVALDIMESISVALGDVECVFILAVDERLIAEGLRLRYPKLFEKEEEDGFSVKGAEYLEKIIQFRTRVPPRRPEQVQGLIAAEYPEWAAVGDIIRLVAGTNPRRVKQYCERLGFQEMTGKGLFELGRRAAEQQQPPPAQQPPPEPKQPPQPSPEEAAPPTTSQPAPARRELRISDLVAALDRLPPNEVRKLALDLGERFDGLPGESFAKQIESLVLNVNARGDFGKLVGEVRAARPDLLKDFD